MKEPKNQLTLLHQKFGNKLQSLNLSKEYNAQSVTIQPLLLHTFCFITPLQQNLIVFIFNSHEYLYHMPYSIKIL